MTNLERTDTFDAEALQLFRRNYWLNGVEGGVYIGGMAFLSVETVIPPMIRDLGGPDWLVATVPMLTLIGVVAMPLLLAHRIERMPRVLPLLRITGALQRLPYLIAGLCLLFLAADYPKLVLAVVALTPLACGIALGSSFSGWMEMLGRLIPRQRRASMYAVRNIITAIIGLGAGLGVREVFRTWSGPPAYGILHLIAFGFITLSYILFCLLREPHYRRAHKAVTRSLADNLQDLPKILGADARFRRYCLCRMFHYGVFIMLPFLSIHALAVTGRSNSFLGVLVSASMCGGIVGNLIAGWSGDRYGGKHLLIAARGLFVTVCLAATLNESAIGFCAIYFLYGVGINLDRVGTGTLNLEISPEDRRPTYISLIAVACLPGMVAAPICSTLVRRYSRSFTPAALLAGGAVILSLYFLLQVAEPRRETAAAES